MRPRSLRAQLGWLILLAFVAAQALALWLFADERGAAIRAAQRAGTVERALALADALSGTDPRTRDAILAAASSPAVRVGWAPGALVPPGADRAIPPRLLRRLTAPLPAGDRAARVREIALAPHGGHRADPPPALERLHRRALDAGMAPVALQVSVPLASGGWLNVDARFRRPDLQLPPVLLGTGLLSLVLIMAALWWGLRRITRPLNALARTAEGLRLDGPPPAMPQGGPREVQALSDALGRMHARLAGLVADRTRMLAALGHDLRSPITALRVQADMVDDPETRDRMDATLTEMQEMVEATLAYARGVSSEQPTEPVALDALLRDLTEELGLAPPEGTGLTLPLRRTAMRRALRNLLENAQRYGGGVRVRLIPGDPVRIEIDDDGPGIPAAERARVFEPFVRLETSRSRETGGTGLGLPIARAILRAHGGDVTLTDRPGGGLRACVTLPRAPD